MPELFGPSFLSGGLEANKTIKDDLQEALGRRRARQRISVTDLVNPRLAYFRRIHPEIQIPADRLQAMFAGTGFHALFGPAISSEEYLEQFLEWEDIVGKVDIYEDVPVEVKTTASLPDDVLVQRPSYVDQLGMYCVMARKSTGRLIIVRRAYWGNPAAVRVLQVTFLDPEAIAAGMRQRRDQLVAALESHDPSGLTECEWAGRSCEYLQLCGCDVGCAPERVVDAASVLIDEVPEMASGLLDILAVPEKTTRTLRLNDLVFPRKARFELRREPAAREDPEETLADMQRLGFERTLRESLRYGLPGDFLGVPVSIRTVRGTVGLFRGVPTIIRTNRWSEMMDRDKLPRLQPHYFDRLAIECALTANERGRLVLYYANVAGGDKFMVYDVRFKELGGIVAEADRRAELLETDAPPLQLPACPEWMAKFCEFSPECGCGPPKIDPHRLVVA